MKAHEDRAWSAKIPAAGGQRVSGAVILGGAHGELAIARSLGRRGVPVVHIGHDHPLVGLSIYVRRKFRWEGPDAPDALERLLEIGRANELQDWVLFAGGDAEVRFASRHREALSEFFRVTSPSWEITRLSDNKRLLYRYAESIGVDCPRSDAPQRTEDSAFLEGPFPVVLKAATHGRRNALTMAKCWKAANREELIRLCDEALALQGPGGVVVQEFISGAGEHQFSYAAVWNDGAPIASLVARRRRQLPIDFGFTSTFVETIENARIESAAEKLLTSLKFSGLVELEFKFDAREDRYKLLDFNNRAWTWISLGAAAGVDFPCLTYLLAIGQHPQSARGRAGVVWMHLARDLASVVLHAKAGKLRMADYLNCWRRPRAWATFAWDDPLASFLEIPLTFHRALRLRGPAILRKASSPSGSIADP